MQDAERQSRRLSCTKISLLQAQLGHVDLAQAPRTLQADAAGEGRALKKEAVPLARRVKRATA
jgi:hypothetical protein